MVTQITHASSSMQIVAFKRSLFFIFLHSTHSSGFRRLTQYALWGWRAADSELYCIWGAAWCSAIGCSIDTINHWDHALAPARNLKAFLGYKSRLVLSTALTSQVLRPTRQFQKNEWIYKQSTIRDDCIFHPGKIPYILLLKIWIHRSHRINATRRISTIVLADIITL